MPNPKRKHSHARSAKRRTHFVTEMPEVTETKQVGGEPLRLRHHASPDGVDRKGRKLPGFGN